MEVGLGAADAIRSVHGMNYTVGTSPDVLCKSMLGHRYNIFSRASSVAPGGETLKYVPSFYRRQLWFIQRLGSVSGDPFLLHLWAER